VKLRQIFLNSLPASTIRWGKQVSKVVLSRCIEFDEGRFKERFAVIVCADGAWSKVRPPLAHVPPFYSDGSRFDTDLVGVDRQHPEISRMVGKGSFLVFGEEDRQLLLFQRNGNGTIRCYATKSEPELWIKSYGFNVSSTEDLKKVLTNDYANWSPDLTRTLKDFNVDDEDYITPRRLYALPIGLRWPSVSEPPVSPSRATQRTW